MKNLLLGFGVLMLLFSCNSSQKITIDTVAQAEKLKEYQTFQLVEEDYFDKRNERIKLTFREKLVEYGFDESAENPDFLVQAMVVTRKFIQELGHYSSTPYPLAYSSNNGIPSGGTNEFVVNRGMIGKVIFLIQDAKTNEIAWMGVGTGIISGDGQLNPEDLNIALYEMLASINE